MCLCAMVSVKMNKGMHACLSLIFSFNLVVSSIYHKHESFEYGIYFVGFPILMASYFKCLNTNMLFSLHRVLKICITLKHEITRPKWYWSQMMGLCCFSPLVTFQKIISSFTFMKLTKMKWIMEMIW